MHELSLVSELVDECCRRAEGGRVSLVRVRCALPDAEDELQQAFVMLSADTPLEGAVLEIEPVALRIACKCGYEGAVDGVIGHMYICPSCGKVGPFDSASLELLEVRKSPAS